MEITQIIIELKSGHRLEADANNATLGGLSPADAELLGKLATPDTMAEHFKAIDETAVRFLKNRQWR